ncbi:TatD family hydrolase [Candidatus Woesearchaeota archaeon]|nr:TatD family hydrolase [Candidatus Woesearchaeota archaeon]
MKITDAHAHMEFEDYDKDRDEVIERCRKNNVKYIVNNGTNPESNRKTLELSKKYNIILPALGYYPLYVMNCSEEEFNKELMFIEENKPVAIGEIGLDFSKGDKADGEHELDEKDKENMIKYFKKLINLGKKLNIPLIIHSRKAELETIEILEKLNYKKIIMHCFSGRKHLVKRIIDNKWYFSIPVNITYLHHFQNIVNLCPENKLLTETDSPFLGPKGIQRNDPTHINQSLKKMSEIKNIKKEEMADVIFNNFTKLFLKK